MQQRQHSNDEAKRIRSAETHTTSGTEMTNSERSLREAQTVKNSPPSEEEDVFATGSSPYVHMNAQKGGDANAPT